MSYIPLEAHLPGITGLLEYRKDSVAPIRELTQILLRGPSALTEAERELIAAVVSNKNERRFCTAAHTAAANILLGEAETSEKVKHDITTAPVSEKMKALLTIASHVQVSGKNVTEADIRKAKDEGATDIEVHDMVLIAAACSMFNSYVDGLATFTPTDKKEYETMGIRVAEKGYVLPKLVLC